jgi:predicted 3-demethylubiquinone-9 3-methyltransferase (glyoxalase superfamily)
MKRIVPNLWFDTEAEAAAAFYTGIFPDSRVVAVTRYGGPGRARPVS